MALYLVQHGKAKSKDEDPEQRLTDLGTAEVKTIADVARALRVKVGRIEHSVKARARETADIFCEGVSPPGGIIEREGLKPMDDVTALKDEIKPEDNLMLVGHLPFMERLTSYLIIGSQEPMVMKFQNGGIVCLDKLEGADYWHIKWTLLPNIE